MFTVHVDRAAAWRSRARLKGQWISLNIYTMAVSLHPVVFGYESLSAHMEAAMPEHAAGGKALCTFFCLFLLRLVFNVKLEAVARDCFSRMEI